MARSIGNTPTPTASGGGGGVLAAILAVRERREERALDKKKLQATNRDKLINKMQGMPEAEQAELIELLARDPHLEDQYDLTVEGLKQLTRPSTTAAGGRDFTAPGSGQSFRVSRPVLFSGETVSQRGVRARTEVNEAAAREARVRANLVEVQAKSHPDRAVIELRSTLTYHEDDGSIRPPNTDEAKRIYNGAATEEDLSRIQTRNKQFDDTRMMIRQVVESNPSLGNPADWDNRWMRAALITPTLLQEMGVHLQNRRLDLVAMQIEMAEKAAAADLKKRPPGSLTDRQIIELQQQEAGLVSDFIEEFSPGLADPKQAGLRVRELTPQGDVVLRRGNWERVKGWFGGPLEPTIPVETRGATANDKRFFQSAAFYAMAFPMSLANGPAVQEFGLPIPTIEDLGNPAFADAMVAAYENWLGYEIETFSFPSAEEGEPAKLYTRDFFVGKLAGLHAKLAVNLKARVKSNEKLKITGLQKEREAAGVAGQFEESREDKLLDLAGAANDIGSPESLKALQDEMDILSRELQELSGLPQDNQPQTPARSVFELAPPAPVVNDPQ